MKRTVVLPVEYLNDVDKSYLTPDAYHSVCGVWNDGIKVKGDKVIFDYESDHEEYTKDELKIADLDVTEEVYETVKIGKHECTWKQVQIPITSIRDFTDDDFKRISSSWVNNDLS